jgi:hypothetical protein
VTNLEKHARNVSDLIEALKTNPNEETLSAARAYKKTIHRSRLHWSYKDQAIEKINAALVWYVTRNRPKVLEGGALVSRRSTAQLRLIS